MLKKRILYFIFIPTLLFFGGCVNLPKIAETLDSLPLQTKIKIAAEGNLIAEGHPDLQKIKVEEEGKSVEKGIYRIIMFANPESSFFRIYPDNLFFTLEQGDVFYRCKLGRPIHSSPGQLVIFLSSENRYKGYFASSCYKTSFKDSDKGRRAASEKIFASKDMEHLRAELKWLDTLNEENVLNEKRYFIYPKLPFVPQSKSKNPHSFEHIKGRIKKY